MKVTILQSEMNKKEFIPSFMVRNKTMDSNSSYLWSCCRNNANSAWYANGNNGFFNNNNFNNSNSVLPVAELVSLYQYGYVQAVA